jgi:hypothetical protein
MQSAASETETEREREREREKRGRRRRRGRETRQRQTETERTGERDQRVAARTVVANADDVAQQAERAIDHCAALQSLHARDVAAARDDFVLQPLDLVDEHRQRC